MAEEKKILIPGRLKNIAVSNYLAGASDIIDDSLGKSQQEINAEVTSTEEDLDTRLNVVEQLAEISVAGGEIGIATANDLKNRTTAGDAKIPTVAAVMDSAEEVPTAGSEHLITSGGVFDATSIRKNIDLTSLYEIPFVLWQDKWYDSNGQNFSKHICVRPGQTYIVSTGSTYKATIFFLSVFNPGKNVATSYTQVQIDEGVEYKLTIPSGIYHLVFLDNHNQSGGFSLIPTIEQIVYTSDVAEDNHEDIMQLYEDENSVVYDNEIAEYGFNDCTNNGKTLKVGGGLGGGSGFKTSDFIQIPNGVTHVEYKNVTANYHDELCGLVIADNSYNVLWYNSESYGRLSLAQYPTAVYIRFMPLYNTQYASVRLIQRNRYNGLYISLASGAFDMQGNITTNASRAYTVIRNPQNIVSVADGYAMIVFGGNITNPVELFVSGIDRFDASVINHPTLWIMVRDSAGTDIDISARDLSQVLSIGGRLDSLISKADKMSSSPLSVYIVDKDGNGQFTSISDAVAGVPDGSTILVTPGTYEESVHMWSRNLNIIGVDKNSCIVVNGTGNYTTPPFEANMGSISNLTIIADNYAPTIEDPTIEKTKPSYCFHIEHAESEAFQLRISNCIMVAKWNAAIGLGLRYNQTVIIEDCDIRTECVKTWSEGSNMWVEQGAIFFHNDAAATNNGTGHLRVSNCRLSGLKPALSVLCVYNHPYVVAEFVNNTLISDTYGIGDGVIYKRGQIPAQGYWSGDRISLSIASHGNNVDDINA